MYHMYPNKCNLPITSLTNVKEVLDEMKTDIIPYTEHIQPFIKRNLCSIIILQELPIYHFETNININSVTSLYRCPSLF